MINGLIAIGIYLVAQTIGGVWWAATISAQMRFMLNLSNTVKTVEDKLAATALLFSTKAEVATALLVSEKSIAMALASSQKETAISLAHNDKERDAMWKRIDSLTGIIRK